MGTRRPPPPGLDYVPVAGDDPNFVFGVIRATLAGVPNSASNAVFRRLFPVARPESFEAPWPRPTCYRHDVLLPPWTSPDWVDPQALCQAYDRQCWVGVKDLAIIMNFRFPEALRRGSEAPRISLTEAYELVRGYCYEKIVLERGLATILAMHLPSLAGIDWSPPHVHACSLARVVGLGFEAFVPELTKDSSRKIFEREWLDYRRLHGHG
jgi:hypothetical protein